MANGTTDRGALGIGLGGILVALVGLVAFGGFAKGKWY